MPHGKICYLEIPANKAKDSAEFYSRIFGWKVRERGDGNLAFDDSGSVSGTWVKEKDRTPDERTRIYIMVDSIVNALSAIQKSGGKTLTRGYLSVQYDGQLAWPGPRPPAPWGAAAPGAAALGQTLSLGSRSGNRPQGSRVTDCTLRPPNTSTAP